MSSTIALYERDITHARWFKGTKSANDDPPDNCVEVAAFADAVAMRDSKDLSRPPLRFTDTEWEAFIAGAKAGEFDFFG